MKASLIIFLMACMALTGCVTAQVEQLRTKPKATVKTGESVVVLGRRQHFRRQTESDFTECVNNKLEGRQGLPVMSEQQFMDRMFPWFEPRTAPLNENALARRLEDPVLMNRLTSIGARYVVWLDGKTRRTDDGGSMSCALGPGGGGCLGMVWWENQSAYVASIWDIQEAVSLGKITVDASGTSYVPAVIVPVPIIARAQAAACSSMAQQIEEFIQPKISDR